MNFKNITTLSLIISYSCNANCSYCFVNKQEMSKIDISMEQYIIQVQNLFSKLKIDPLKINKIKLMGLEPSLTIINFGLSFNKWLKFFPNLKYIQFSTNGLNIDNILNFISILDKLNQNLILQIQISYDGINGQNNSRQINSDILYKNIIKLTSYNIKNLNIEINYNGILTKTNLEQLNNKEKIYNYYQDLYTYLQLNTTKNIQIKNFNLNLDISSTINTKLDGKNLYQFGKESQLLIKQYPEYKQIFLSLIQYRSLTENLKNYPDIHTWYWSIKKGFNTNFLNTDHLFCDSYKSNIIIDYNGNILYCPYSLFTKEYAINLNTDNQLDIDQTFNLFNNIQCYNWDILFNNYMQLLNKSIDNIHPQYQTNKDLLYKHLLLFFKYDNCLYSNYQQTRQLLLPNTNGILLMFNGFMNIIEDEYNNILKENA